MRSNWPIAVAAALAALAVASPRVALAQASGQQGQIERNFAGSVQLDYMAVPTEDIARRQTLDGATVELSLKLAMDFGDNLSSNVKICVACHGLEVGMAFFDIRIADQVNFRIGRFTPAFGEFPLRHDPANHLTSDKPLPYDMGRMLRLTEWNMSILPAPWVDNGIEINGTQFIGDLSQIDYAWYAVGGPRGASDAQDFDYIRSRNPDFYYVDNNSRPTLGGRVAGTLGFTETSTLSLGVSAMYGTYDDDNQLEFIVLGTDAVVQLGRVFFRAEYLIRRTEFALGTNPEERFRYGPDANGVFDDFFIKDGFTTELEVPVKDRLTLVARWDGLRRRGNVLINSPLRSESAVLRYTAAAAYRIRSALRLKGSVEYYDFSDFEDEAVLHLGIAGPF